MPKLYEYLGLIIFFLTKQQLKNFEELVRLLADKIVQSWISYFVYNKKIVSKNIQGKLK